MNQDLKHLFDISTLSVLVATFFDALPHLAALLTVIWFFLRIVESLQNMGYIKKRRIIYTRRDDGNNKDHDHE